MKSFDPFKNRLATLIEQVLAQKVPQSLTAEEIESLLEFPQDKNFGDYALPCFRLAKMLKKSPQDIGQILKEALEQSAPAQQLLSEVNPVAGFLNLKLKTSLVASELFQQVLSGNYYLFPRDILATVPEYQQKIMIEFSQPNTHKEFHVGHGRNVCLGDAIHRLYEYFGYQVMAVNYIGDEGTHIAKCLYAVEKSKESLPESGKAEWLGKKYTEANSLLETATEDEKKLIEKRISEILTMIEKQQEPIYSLWKKTRQDCLEDFERIYRWLHVRFDHVFYESETSVAAQKVVDEYLAQGIFEESDGAIGLNMEEEKLGFMMVRKSDGNTLYITKDIVLARMKFEQFKVDKNLYVVGNEQDFHFRQLFNFLKKAKFKQAEQCAHMSYGMVRRADGKMSSRKGNSFTFLELVDLVREALAPYLEKYSEKWSVEKIRETADLIATGAIKYGMLNTDPKKDIVFEPHDWVKFDGNSGPYLLYTHARARSILEKAQEEKYRSTYAQNELECLVLPDEKNLVMEMNKFNAVCFDTLQAYRPSMLTHYLFGLCQGFNQFYVNSPIMKESNEQIRSARLALVECFVNMSDQGFCLLGITAPHKM